MADEEKQSYQAKNLCPKIYVGFTQIYVIDVVQLLQNFLCLFMHAFMSDLLFM